MTQDPGHVAPDADLLVRVGLDVLVVSLGLHATQLAHLQELGCDEMQGFPVTAERFEQLMMLEASSPGRGRLVPARSAPPPAVARPQPDAAH